MLDFKKLIESTHKLIIPSVSSLPRNLYFPAAKEITIINWNRKQIYSSLHPRNFPNAIQINYLCDEPLPFQVGTIFIRNNNTFKFAEYPSFGIDSKLEEVPQKNTDSLNYIEYYKLIKYSMQSKYIQKWNKYINQVRKEIH